MNIRTVFWSAFFGLFVLIAIAIFTISTHAPETIDPPGEPMAQGPFSVIGIVFIGTISLACISSYAAIKKLDGLKMIVSVVLSWVIPVFGPLVAFLVATSQNESASPTNRRMQPN